MSEKNIYVDEIGNVKIRKSKRSKNVSISLKPNKGVVLTIPYFVSYKYGLKLIDEKKKWILKHLPKIQALEKKVKVFDENTVFSTYKRTLDIKSHNSDKITGRINSDSVVIRYPEGICVENDEIQLAIRTIITKALRSEAKEYLPEQTAKLAAKFNFTYNKIFIKNNKTLWGSCSGKNNINLNLHLMLLPNHLIDYVIIHELCHTVEKNHGKGFWNLMNTILGDAKLFSKELKQHSIQFQ